MAFSRDVKEQLLVKCHRHCCICHESSGNKMEVHHIIPEEQDGENTEENGIPLCFKCHAEVEAYNSKHPKGNKFTPSELKKHKKQWFDICKNPPWSSTVGVSLNTPWNVPYRPNPNFTGREKAMERLHELLLGKDKVVQLYQL